MFWQLLLNVNNYFGGAAWGLEKKVVYGRSGKQINSKLIKFHQK